MTGQIEHRYNLIREQEKGFSKLVVYRMRAQTPPPWWHMFIPFKFLFEHLRLRQDVRRFQEKHLFLKKLALDAAYTNIVLPEETSDAARSMQPQIREWLHSQQVDSNAVLDSLLDLAELLFEHYSRLLQAEADDYRSMVGTAYASRAQYSVFLHHLTKTEEQVDREILNALDIQGPEPWIQNKQQALQEIRKRDVQDIFGKI